MVDLAEAEDDDLAECGLKKPEVKRLRRTLAELAEIDFLKEANEAEIDDLASQVEMKVPHAKALKRARSKLQLSSAAAGERAAKELEPRPEGHSTAGQARCAPSSLARPPCAGECSPSDDVWWSRGTGVDSRCSPLKCHCTACCRQWPRPRPRSRRARRLHNIASRRPRLPRARATRMLNTRGCRLLQIQIIHTYFST